MKQSKSNEIDQKVSVAELFEDDHMPEITEGEPLTDIKHPPKQLVKDYEDCTRVVVEGQKQLGAYFKNRNKEKKETK